MVYSLQAKRQIRERREKGIPDPKRTREQQAALERSFPELAKLRKKLEKMEAQLRKLGINPDDGSPPLPESGSDGQKAP